MSEYKITFGVFAAILGVVQYFPYVVDIIKGKTKPHAFSWFVWGLPAGIVFAAQLLKGGGAGSWATGMTAFLCTVIFILSLFRGEPIITRLDWVCLGGSLIALGLWASTHNPLWAVVLVTVADVVAFVPTIRKSIAKPHEETVSTYITGGIKWLVSITALQTYSLTTLLYPVVMVLANWFFVIWVVPRRKYVHTQTTI